MKRTENRKKVLALILAGGVGGRLGLLTEKRAKPVVPFGGFYRLIDFALSNCRHSQISDVWVIEQYELHTLNEHLSNGRPWDLDKTYGGLQVLPPFEEREKRANTGGFASGNADAIIRHLDFIKDFAPDILIVLSADHIYKFDFRDALETHFEKRAALTIVTTKLPAGEHASRFGVVTSDNAGRITNFEYKPEKPQSDTITTEIFVYDAEILLGALRKLSKRQDKLQDYGDELIPYLVETQAVFEHRHKGYWRDVGTIESYFAANMDLLDKRQKIDIDDQDWTILTNSAPLVPAFIASSAKITNSLISNGARVFGSVEKSILSPGAVVEKGAHLEECIVLPGATVRKGVKLKRAIIDQNANVTAEKLKKYKNEKDILVIGQRKIQTAKEIAAEAEQN